MELSMVFLGVKLFLILGFVSFLIIRMKTKDLLLVLPFSLLMAFTAFCGGGFIWGEAKSGTVSLEAYETYILGLWWPHFKWAFPLAVVLTYIGWRQRKRRSE